MSRPPGPSAIPRQRRHRRTTAPPWRTPPRRSNTDWTHLIVKTAGTVLWGLGGLLALLTVSVGLILSPQRTKAALTAATDPARGAGLARSITNGVHAFITTEPPARPAPRPRRTAPRSTPPKPRPKPWWEQDDDPSRGNDQPSQTPPPQPRQEPPMSTTTAEPTTSQIDGSTESLRGLETMGASLATAHEENAAALTEAAKAVQAVAEERARAARIALVLGDVDGEKLGKDLFARIQAYIELRGQAKALEEQATALEAEAKNETACGEAARAFGEEAGSFANEMADVRQTGRLGQFEKAD